MLLDARLTDDERMICDVAEGYSQERLQPRIVSANRAERFDREIMAELGELGCSAHRSTAMAAPTSSTSQTAWSRARSRALIRATATR